MNYNRSDFKRPAWAGRLLRRAAYELAAFFLPNGVKRHYMGYLTEKVTDFFASPVQISSGDKVYYVSVEEFELGDNPFVERVTVYFTLTDETTCSESLTKWRSPGEKELTLFSTNKQSIATETTHLTLVYTFSDDTPFDESITNFRSFVSKRAGQAHIPPGSDL